MENAEQADRVLMDRILQKDDGRGDAAAELYRRYRPSLMLFARQFTGDDASAEDLATDALMNAWDRLAKGHDIDSLRNYLRACVRNRFVSQRRVARRHTSLEDFYDEHGRPGGGSEVYIVRYADSVTETDAEGAAIRSAQIEEIFTAFDGLAPRHRAILWMTLVEERHPAEVGDLWGITPNAAAALAYRARKALAQSIQRGRGLSAQPQRQRPTSEAGHHITT